MTLEGHPIVPVVDNICKVDYSKHPLSFSEESNLLLLSSYGDIVQYLSFDKNDLTASDLLNEKVYRRGSAYNEYNAYAFYIKNTESIESPAFLLHLIKVANLYSLSRALTDSGETGLSVCLDKYGFKDSSNLWHKFIHEYNALVLRGDESPALTVQQMADKIYLDFNYYDINEER